MYKVDFNKPIHVYFMGIGGISMSGLAEILLKEGFKITGSDSKASEMTDHLIGEGASVYFGQKASNITDDIDLVVYTAAISADNEEYVEVVNREIPMMTRAQLLGQIMDNYKYSVAVSGTHGKTTTTSMMSHIFLEADADPTITVGGMLDAIGGNIRVGDSGYFITEACEYTNSFHAFNPYISVILNVEADHLDFFSGIDEIIESFKVFANKLHKEGLLVINGDMDCTDKIIECLDARVATFGLASNNKYSAKDIVSDDKGCMSYTLVVDGIESDKVVLSVCGMHNVTNSLSAIAVADELGFDRADTLEGIKSFGGAHRRFEHKGTIGNVTIVDDYAHHPTEIRATLESAKNASYNDIWCVFQPHTYTRTKALLNEFAEALRLADHIVLTDIYAAREKNTGEIHSKDLLNKILEYDVDAHYFPSFDDVENYLLINCKKNDLLITMGAGDVVTIGESLLGK